MKNHRNCRLVILLFFLVYGVSPLTYDLSSRSLTAGAGLGTAALSFSNASLYLLETLYGAIARPFNAGEDPPAKRILIRKKVAVTRGKDIIVLKLTRAVSHPSAPVDLRSLATTGSVASVPTSLKRSAEYMPLSSGLSPPVPS